GRRARDLHRVLHRLGTGVHEERLRLAPLCGPGLVERLAPLYVRLVHADHEALVQVPVDLFVESSGGEAVPGVLAAEPAREVDVLPSVDVPEPGSLRARDDQRRRRPATGDVALALSDNTIRCCALLDGHQACFRSPRISST